MSAGQVPIARTRQGRVYRGLETAPTYRVGFL